MIDVFVISISESLLPPRFGSERRQRKEINLCLILLSIVLVFFLCHAARIILDVYEFANVEKVITCKPWFPEFWAQALNYISHLTMIINSSVNFIVYCLVGYTFRRELCRFLGLKAYKPVPVSEVSRRPSAQKYECSNGNGLTTKTSDYHLRSASATSPSQIEKRSMKSKPEGDTDEIAYYDK